MVDRFCFFFSPSYRSHCLRSLLFLRGVSCHSYHCHPLYVISLFLWLLLRFFIFNVGIQKFDYDCQNVVFFLLTLLEVSCWIFGLMSYIHFGKFSTIISSNITSVAFSFSPLSSVGHLTLSHESQILCSFPLIDFFLYIYDG